MQMNDMILVSVDDHVCEPPDMWDNHVPAKWKDRAPKLITKDDGSNLWVFEGGQIPNVGSTPLPAARPRSTAWSRRHSQQLRPGCYDVDARVEDMNANGVLGSLCFPTVPGLRRRALRSQGRRGRDGARHHDAARLQRLAHRRVVRQAPRPLHPPGDPAHVGPGGDGPRGEARRRGRVATPSPSPTTRVRSGIRACTTRTGIHSGRPAPTRARSSASTSARARAWPCRTWAPHRDHDRGHADHALQLRHRAGLLGCPAEVPGPEGRAVRGRHRLDPVLPRAHRLRPPPPPPLDPARLPERQEAQRRLPRAHRHLLHRRRRGRAESRPDRHRQHHLGVRLPALRLDLARGAREAVAVPGRVCPTTRSTRSPGRTPPGTSSTTPSSTFRRSSAPWARCAPRPKHVDLSLKVGGGGKKPSDYEKGYCTIGDVVKQMAFALSTPFDSSQAGPD